MQWENVYIFISSTFNDMHAERDYLVKSVFPALSEWCEERKLRLIDIDLRWGVTAADSEAKNTVRACLRNIDECRPFFLCFLGQRRGWVPGKDDIGADTYEQFPKLLDGRYAGEASVTEMEIIHALIDPLHNGILRGTKDDSRSGQAAEHAFFFLRKPGYLDAIPCSQNPSNRGASNVWLPHPDLRAIYTNEAEKNNATADTELTRWREKEIPGTGRPVFSYTTEWQKDESTPEIALPLCIPTTAPKDSEVWQNAFTGWAKRWAAIDVAVDDSGEITGVELEKAKAYNTGLIGGRLGNFRVGDCALAEVVIEQLKEAITKRYPGHTSIEKQTPLQKELDQQAQFLRVASEGFIERAGDFDALNDYLQSKENRPFAMTAHAGMGKTSLLAHFIDTYRVHDGESLHYRFIGGSDDSISAEKLIRSLLLEMKESEKIESDIPANPIDMMTKLPDLLAEAGSKGKTVLIIDALNQLESGMGDLYWIPSVLPDNVKLAVSFKLGEESADEYYRQMEKSCGMILHKVKPFDSMADREALVTAYLEQYFKELDRPRIKTLINSSGANNPLFLKATLSELRVFGVHNDLSEVIKSRFGNTPVSAFTAILSRMENDPAHTKLKPDIALPHIFGWIAHSRYGLSVDELVDLLMLEYPVNDRADVLDAIYLILRQLRPFMAKRDGRVDFFYESFKIAAIERYTGSHRYARATADWHKSLAVYFETLPLGNRKRLMEQAWQYAHAGMEKEYEDLLNDFVFNQNRLTMFGPDALIEDCGYLESDSTNVLREFYQIAYSILQKYPDQLATQLWGRLSENDSPFCLKLLSHTLSVKEERCETWLRPLFQCMDAPGAGIDFVLGNASDDLGFCIALSPDETIMVTELRPNKLAIWDLEARRIIHKITFEEEGLIQHICFAPDGASFAVRRNFLNDEGIHVWDAVNYTELCRITNISNCLIMPQGGTRYKSLSGRFMYTNDSRCILAQTKGGLAMFDVYTGNILSTVENQLDIYSFGMGRNLIAAGSLKWSKTVYYVEDPYPIENKKRSFFSKNPKKKKLQSFSISCTILLFDYNAEDNSISLRSDILEGHPSYVDLVSVSEDDRYIVSASIEGDIRLWDVGSACMIKQVDIGRQISGMCFIESGSKLLASCYDGFIYKLTIPDLVCENKISCSFGGIADMEIYKDESRCLVLSDNRQTIKRISLHDTKKNKSCGTPIKNIGFDRQRSCVIASSFQNYIEAGYIPVSGIEKQGKLFFFDARHNFVSVASLDGAEMTDFIYLSPDGKSVVSKDGLWSDNGRDNKKFGINIKRWDLTNLPISNDSIIPKKTFSVTDFRTSEDGHVMNRIRFSSNFEYVVVSQPLQRKIVAFDINTGNQLCRIEADSLEDDEDNRYCYESEVSQDGILYMLNYKTGKLLQFDVCSGTLIEAFVLEGFKSNNYDHDSFQNNGMIITLESDKLLYYDEEAIVLIDIDKKSIVFALERGNNKPCKYDDYPDSNCFTSIDSKGEILCTTREISDSPREECFDVWDTRTGLLLSRFHTEGHLSNAVIKGNVITIGLASGYICSFKLENMN